LFVGMAMIQNLFQIEKSIFMSILLMLWVFYKGVQLGIGHS